LYAQLANPLSEFNENVYVLSIGFVVTFTPPLVI